MAKRRRDEQPGPPNAGKDQAETQGKAKKRKHKSSDEEQTAPSQVAEVKHAKKKAAAKEKSADPVAVKADGEPSVAEPSGDLPKTVSSKDTSTQKKKSRFIVFVGNLPYTATTETITEHFSKIHPESVRHITEKSSDDAQPSKSRKAPKGPKSKGFAFLEFEGYDRMKTCLKLYHHSNFDDGKSPARKINVELTAGGGGNKSKARNEKLRVKNEKLTEERKQQREKESQQQSEKPETAEPVATVSGDVHPSRRSRVPGR